MPFNFENLDDRTRQLMFDEVDRDLAEGTLYERGTAPREGRRVCCESCA